MKLIPQNMFDTYALSFPRGHDFGDMEPVGAWQSDDGLSYGVVFQNIAKSCFDWKLMRRRVDHVWSAVEEGAGLPSREVSFAALKARLDTPMPREPMPANTAPRPKLHDLGDRTPSDIFSLLNQRTHAIAAWLFNQLYVAMPAPDKNWAADCQTRNTHTRLWEALLLASFREQGLLVTQPHEAPDFRLENRAGEVAWVEAVTANPPIAYDHVNAPPSERPGTGRELFFGDAALRFAKTIGNKLQKKYTSKTHVAGRPFAIALADFHASASMVWSREALIGYLYGSGARSVDVEGRPTPEILTASHLLGPAQFPAGLFNSPEASELSAVIFSNAASIAKLNRVGASMGMDTRGLRYVRYGHFHDPTPGAQVGIPFCMDVTSEAYRSLWPSGYEPWTAEMEVFHNPFAEHPLDHSLFPKAAHWFERDGLIDHKIHYEHSILSSMTLIQEEDAPMPAVKDLVDVDVSKGDISTAIS